MESKINQENLMDRLFGVTGELPTHWHNFSVFSMSQFLRECGSNSLIKGPHVKAEVEELHRLYKHKQLWPASVHAKITSSIRNNKKISCFDAFSQVSAPTLKFILSPNLFANDKGEKVVCTLGIAKGPDVKVDIAAPAKLLAGVTHVVNGKVTSLKVAKDTAATEPFTSQIFAMESKDIVKSIVPTFAPTDVLSGNKLAGALYDVMKPQPHSALLVTGQIIGAMPDAIRKKMSTKKVRVVKGGEVRIGRKIISTMSHVPSWRSKADWTQVPSVSKALFSTFALVQAIRGGSKKGMAVFAHESWDGIPMDSDRRLQINLLYDMFYLGFFKENCLVLQTADRNFAELVRAQMPPKAIVVIEGKGSSVTPQHKIAVASTQGGVIVIPSLDPETLFDKMASHRAVLKMESEVYLAQWAYFCPSLTPLPTDSHNAARTSAIEIRNWNLRVAKKYYRWAVYNNYIAISKTCAVDLDVTNMSSNKIRKMQDILDLEWENHQDINLYPSTFSHSSLYYLESSIDAPHKVDHETMWSILVSYMYHSLMYTYTGFSYLNYLTVKKIWGGHVGPVEIKILKGAPSDVILAMTDMVSPEEIEEIRSKFSETAPVPEEEDETISDEYEEEDANVSSEVDDDESMSDYDVDEETEKMKKEEVKEEVPPKLPPKSPIVISAPAPVPPEKKKKADTPPPLSPAPVVRSPPLVHAVEEFKKRREKKKKVKKEKKDSDDDEDPNFKGHLLG